MSREIEVLPFCFFRNAISNETGPWINLFWESEKTEESIKRIQSEGVMLSTRWTGVQSSEALNSLDVAVGLVQDLIIVDRHLKVQSTVQQLVENLCDSTELSMTVKKNDIGRYLEFSKVKLDDSTGRLPALSRGSCFVLECQTAEDAVRCRQKLGDEQFVVPGVRRTSMGMPRWHIDTAVLLSPILEFVC